MNDPLPTRDCLHQGHASASVWVADGEARACPHDAARTSAWPWRNWCHAEFPEITADYVGAFDLNDYTAQTWTMTGADGHVIASVRIGIESRA